MESYYQGLSFLRKQESIEPTLPMIAMQFVVKVMIFHSRASAA
jgi:hypothetical protein